MFQAQLARALHARHVSPGRTGAIVLDLQTGDTLFAHNPQLPLRPASNEKLATTYAALTALGPSFRIDTDVLGDGQQSGATWQGNLVLKGYGDPALSFAQLNSLARQVAGDRDHARERPDPRRRELVRHAPHRARLEAGLLPPRVAGALGAHRQPRLDGTVRDEAARADGGAGLPARPAPRGRRPCTAGPRSASPRSRRLQLGEVESAPLSGLVRHMDVYSDNFYAEMLLKEVGAVQGSGGSSAAGIAVERRLLGAAGVPLAGVRMVDGSGLSLLDRWTPLGLATLLRTMWQDSDLHPYLVPALPIAGETGTLEHRMRQAAGPRSRPRQDRHDGQLVVAVGLRRRPLQLLDPRERQPGARAERRAVAEPRRAGARAGGGRRAR